MRSNKYIAMLAAAIVGLIAGLITLRFFGQPTPFD